jgi:hypothetical protein
MPKVVHIIGNGDQAVLYQRAERKGLKICCNLPPFAVPDSYASVIVDFKFMKAMTSGDITLPGDWILGMRPKIWMDRHPDYYTRVAHQVKEFYTPLPKYAGNYTNFNCGHVAVHYAANKLKADRIHMYGFDSIFDFNLRSYSDLVLNSDRENMNNHRLSSNWRPIWTAMFKEFSKTEFVLHHVHNEFKIKISDNVRAEVYSKK